MTDLPLVWLSMRGTGIVAWALLTAVVVWGLLLRTRFATIGSPLRMLEMHKYLGILALGTLAAHLALVLADSTIGFSVVNVLVPFTAPWEPVAIAAGVLAMWLMIPASVIGRVRHKFGKSGNKWFQKTHVWAYAAWPLATGHYLFAGTDATTWWSLVLLAIGTVSIAFLLVFRGWVGRRSSRPVQRAPKHAAAKPDQPVLVG